MQREGEGGVKASLALFLKIEKSALILEKKIPDCVYLRVKFLI